MVLEADQWQPSDLQAPLKPGTVVIAYHGAKDMPEGTLKSILKQAGLE